MNSREQEARREAEDAAAARAVLAAIVVVLVFGLVGLIELWRWVLA